MQDPPDVEWARALTAWGRASQAPTDEERQGFASYLRELARNLRLRIKEAREARAWSQARLAKELSSIGLHLDPTAITRIEGGERAIRADELWALAVTLRVPIALLLGGDPFDVSLEDRYHAAERQLALIAREARNVSERYRDAENERNSALVALRKAFPEREWPENETLLTEDQS